MARLAQDRDTHLTREEIAAEAVRQFDAGGEPTIRGLASALKVAPAAIYHHFPSRSAIVDAAVELVWQEAFLEGLRLVPDPLTADPVDVLVAAGLATRRAFVAHPGLAPHLAATTEAGDRLARNLSLLAQAFERLGLTGDAAAAAFHAYASHTIGSVLFATARFAGEQHTEPAADAAAPPVSRPFEEVLRLSVVDPVRDEELFVLGLRRLVESFASDG